MKYIWHFLLQKTSFETVWGKGENYKDLKRSFVIFVCTFDLFGKGRHIYTFENRCVQDGSISLGDGTAKIMLNTKGTMDDVTPEMKRLLDFIDGKEPEDDYTRELAEAVESTRKNEKWRLEYMTLQMHYQEKYEQGVLQGIKQGIEQGIEQGLSQGIEQGLSQGMEEEKKQSALRMISAGKLLPEEIALYTGLTLMQVEELEKSQEKPIQ